MTESPKPLIMQRLRNRVIEYLEVLASPEAQLRYQADVPIADVSSEMVNQWEDFMGTGGEWLKQCRLPLYSTDEQQALERFQAVWEETCDLTPDRLPPIAELSEMPEWQRLCAAAATALEVMNRRGTFDEDIEISDC